MSVLWGCEAWWNWGGEGRNEPGASIGDSSWFDG